MLCQQAVEKSMKHLLVENSSEEGDTRFLRSHSVELIVSRLVELGVMARDAEFSGKCARLSGYYFNLNYPGDWDLELSREDAAEALAFAREVAARFLPAL
jgi:HEPN domain-containing protein